jgi:hypothetical protein
VSDSTYVDRVRQDASTLADQAAHAADEAEALLQEG